MFNTLQNNKRIVPIPQVKALMGFDTVGVDQARIWVSVALNNLDYTLSFNTDTPDEEGVIAVSFDPSAGDGEALISACCMPREGALPTTRKDVFATVEAHVMPFAARSAKALWDREMRRHHCAVFCM
jgi:hypothetical protein